MKQIYPLALLLCFLSVPLSGQVIVQDDDLTGGNTYTWTKDNVYMLDGFVYLEDGAILNIEAGTVIKGKETPSTGDNASALIITRGAKIYAIGSALEPVVFTAEVDNVASPSDLMGEDRGLWGGLVILGKARIADEECEQAIEGIPAGEPRALYGAANCNDADDTDNSGVLRYISIRHGGAALSPGNEINGLTLGAVGSETIIENVEVFANDDDGIEWFGGTVSVKWASVSFCGDDSYDYDTGWRGNGQFWLSFQGEDRADNGGEHDGAKPDDNEPTSNPTIFNATFIGSGKNNANAAVKNEHALYFRDGTAGMYANSIFTDFKNFAIQVEDRASGLDSRQRMENGELVVANNIWWDFGEGSELNAGTNGIIQATDDAEDLNCQFLIDHLGNNGNTLENPQIANISRQPDGTFDPRPQFGGPAFASLAGTPADEFFSEVAFKGAFGATLWIRGWTALDKLGYLPAQQEVTIKDEDLTGGNEYNWTSDNIYLLDGFVFVEEGAKLNIGPGTVIKGKETPTTGENASALIISRGAQICAQGTSGAPVIFTAEIDDPSNPDDLGPTDRGFWGGLIILGRAGITDEECEQAIEGIPAAEPRALYGDPNCNFNDSESSGILKYVSIRHGGAALSPGNEINGLTLGAVGSGTSMEHIEVFANDDDGIEWFGGTASVKWAAVSFCGDDSYDYDTGWRGKGQFWLSLQGDDRSDNGGEHDGAKPDDNTPPSDPVIYNATFIGAGEDNANASVKNEHALYFRDGTAGTYANSIFTDFKNFAIQVEDRASGLDSRERMENGEMLIANNIWWGFGEGDELNAGTNGIIQATDDAEDPTAQFLVDHLSNNNNTLEDPMLTGISRTTDGGFNPVPQSGSPAMSGAMADYPDDSFYSIAMFKGAFCGQGVWINGWTALSEYGILNGSISDADTDCGIVDVDDLFVEDKGYILAQSMPNPASTVAEIGFSLPQTSVVNLAVFDQNGQLVKQLLTGERMTEGDHFVEFNVADLPNGVYYYSLQNSDIALTKSLVVIK